MGIEKPLDDLLLEYDEGSKKLGKPKIPDQEVTERKKIYERASNLPMDERRDVKRVLACSLPVAATSQAISAVWKKGGLGDIQPADYILLIDYTILRSTSLPNGPQVLTDFTETVGDVDVGNDLETLFTSVFVSLMSTLNHDDMELGGWKRVSGHAIEKPSENRVIFLGDRWARFLSSFQNGKKAPTYEESHDNGVLMGEAVMECFLNDPNRPKVCSTIMGSLNVSKLADPVDLAGYMDHIVEYALTRIKNRKPEALYYSIGDFSVCIDVRAARTPGYNVGQQIGLTVSEKARPRENLFGLFENPYQYLIAAQTRNYGAFNIAYSEPKKYCCCPPRAMRQDKHAAVDCHDCGKTHAKGEDQCENTEYAAETNYIGDGCDWVCMPKSWLK